MREMQRKLDHDAKLQEFFGVKGNRRVNVELEMREASRKLMQEEQVEKQLNDLESILDDIKVSVMSNIVIMYLLLSHGIRAEYCSQYFIEICVSIWMFIWSN